MVINSDMKVTNLALSPENGVSPEEKRFSKVNGKVCQLKVKVFSLDGTAQEMKLNSVNDLAPVQSVVLDEKAFNEIETSTKEQEVKTEEKKFSVATVRERLRLAKMSVRMRFRRTMIDYKKFYQSVKSKISEDDFKMLKSLTASDVMAIMNQVTPEIIKGKQINTLLGLSSLSKSLRVAGQKLQIPYRLGLQEEKRTKAVTKKRYQDLSSAYNEFVQAVFDYCFGEDAKAGNVTDMANITEADEMDIQSDNVKL